MSRAAQGQGASEERAQRTRRYVSTHRSKQREAGAERRALSLARPKGAATDGRANAAIGWRSNL